MPLSNPARVCTTDYVIKAREPPNSDASVYVDNAGRDEIGLERAGFMYSNLSVAGFRDRLDLGGQYADDTLAGYIAYSLPVNRSGTRISLSYDYSRIEIGSGPLADFDVDGDSWDAGALVIHPSLLRPRLRVDVYGGFDRKRSTTRFADIGSFSTSLATARAGFELRAADSGGVWYLHPAWTTGFEDFGGDRSFSRCNLSVHRLQHLGGRLAALLRLGGQWSDTDLLPASEQFQLGGVATVRGFDEGVLLGDSGYFVSAELQWRWFDGRLTTTLFTDHGGAFSVASPDERADHLTSGGVGLLVDLSRWFTARLGFGVPLGHSPGIDDEPTLHFLVQSRPL
jgi:hemolysin activation/secretion protein